MTEPHDVRAVFSFAVRKWKRPGIAPGRVLRRAALRALKLTPEGQKR